MKTPTFLKSQKPKTFIGKKISPKDGLSVFERQIVIPGYNQNKLLNATIWQGGCGGLGGEVDEGLVRKGIKKLVLCDRDIVEITNLNRQFFVKEDIEKPKALSLAKNLRLISTAGTILKAYPDIIEKYIKYHYNEEFDIALVLVDYNPTRYDVSEYLIKRKKPGIFAGISLDTDSGYVFIQEPGGPCFNCAFPRRDELAANPCPNSPAIKDTLKIIAGFILFSIDSILMGLPRYWNFRLFRLSGRDEDMKSMQSKRKGCVVCEKY